MNAPDQKDVEIVSQVRAILSGAGLRTTAARLAVYRRLQESDSPLTHAEVAENLVPLGFDKATIFRNLVDLVDAGLVRRTELGDHVWRFELRGVDEDHDEKHPHFVCTECGGVTCLHETDLSKLSQKSLDSIGQITEILLKGHCKSCETK
ncbi:MAG: transcriptional repressor [Planctomycetaceae bacterium]|jgi:Fur family ferric uptake transcriptional regulator|nr:transcriptional repressor [Planctomycetaceae bacterium]